MRPRGRGRAGRRGNREEPKLVGADWMGMLHADGVYLSAPRLAAGAAGSCSISSSLCTHGKGQPDCTIAISLCVRGENAPMPLVIGSKPESINLLVDSYP